MQRGFRVRVPAAGQMYCPSWRAAMHRHRSLCFAARCLAEVDFAPYVADGHFEASNHRQSGLEKWEWRCTFNMYINIASIRGPTFLMLQCFASTRAIAIEATAAPMSGGYVLPSKNWESPPYGCTYESLFLVFSLQYCTPHYPTTKTGCD